MITNMKRFLLLCLVITSSIHAFGAIKTYTIKVGETITLTSAFLQSLEGSGTTTTNGYITGDAVAVEFAYSNSIKVTGLKSGYAMFQNSYKYQTTYVFHVIDVIDISIPDNVHVSVGESYTYSPIITDTEATTSLSWTSSNSGVATINSGGMITAVAPGKTTITCTATNGVKTQSLVTVTPLLLSGITISNQSYEMNVDDEMQLSAICSPDNATSKAVKWMSANENIAQVDNEGSVKAIAPGYCSVYCIADDGSGKYDKCLVHVLGESAVKGDINGDGGVTPQDASMILQYVSKKITW